MVLLLMDFTTRQLEIIEAALLLTASGGLSNLTTRHLSSALGITEPALYRHFRNKSEIVKAMIHSFEHRSTQVFGEILSLSLHGLDAVEFFVKDRFRLVVAQPALARVLFSEEQFIDEPEYAHLLLAMMHSHRNHLSRMLSEAQASGALRRDISGDMLFRLILGPVRLIIKQWALSNQAFDLLKSGEQLWCDLRLLLQDEKKYKKPQQEASVRASNIDKQ